ncbi:preprotein translocase subunit SecG [Oceanicola sp. 22II-s10i]|uniref:preprotein translocase subunit SecG n=1 Tax=Oceanicola sp. 22II-s10i TaxID=1317116 RepID=UPI000B5278C7|nr:preprotein translocase subunit SecG [Oceanicola sp. 22II-s10i]OWU84417.1 preprotein translocase subunit SecG [Oceanicola sp. 22II-s10i]
MENVVLIIHLILALGLIGVVLIQRSEGGGLGMGGGGATSGRAAATALGKVTWVLAGAFICTSILLTVIAAEKSAGSSVLDRLTPGASAPADDTTPSIPGDGGSLTPPPSGGEGGLTPSAD